MKTTFPFSDTVQSRLNTAKELGADYTLLVRPDEPDQDVVDRIVGEAALGAEPDVTIDACGFASALRVALKVRLGSIYYMAQKYYSTVQQLKVVL